MDAGHDPNGGFSRSSWCGPGDCVEVDRVHPDGVALRHSRLPGNVLMFTPDEWLAFIGGVKDGEFDLR